MVSNQKLRISWDWNTTRGARSAAIRNHSINPGNDTGGIAPAGTMYRYRGNECVPCTSPELNKLGIFF